MPIEAYMAQNRFRELATELRRKAFAALLSHAMEARELARAACPVSESEHADGSPHMRDTIEVEFKPNGSVYLLVKAPYTGAVVFGHYVRGTFVPPNDFIHPAVDMAVENLKKSLTKIL